MKARASNNYGYNKNLREYARKLRNNMTKAEAALWKYALKGRQRKGYQFRRQRPVLSYIADFMCKELLLIIEVDGVTHHYEEVFERDIKRQIELEEAGFIVIRFSDEDVLENMDSVITEIDKVILSIEGTKNDR